MAQGILRSPRFQHPRLQQAAQDKRYPIKLREKGYSVAAIQYSLHQLRFALPKTMRKGFPDGDFGDETRAALIQLQKQKQLGSPDGKAGPITLTHLDAQVLAMPSAGGAIPGPWHPGTSSDVFEPFSPGGTEGGADTPPPGYASMPATLHATLRRSYDEKTPENFNLADAMGFPPGARTAASQSFKDVLDTLESQGRLAVVKAIHDRCLKIPSLWSNIRAIRWIWHYAQGNGVSQGFTWTSKDPDAAVTLLRGAPQFCQDLPPMSADHQKDLAGRRCLRQTFREVIRHSGEGLHVCLVMFAYRAQDGWGGEHDIHIDRHQIVCERYHRMPAVTLQAPEGSCVYMDLLEHAKDAIPYYLKKFGLDAQLDRIFGGVLALAQQAGGLHAVNPTQVADLFKAAFPLMPQVVAVQAADWLLRTLKSFVPKA